MRHRVMLGAAWLGSLVAIAPAAAQDAGGAEVETGAAAEDGAEAEAGAEAEPDAETGRGDGTGVGDGTGSGDGGGHGTGDGNGHGTGDGNGHGTGDGGGTGRGDGGGDGGGVGRGDGTGDGTGAGDGDAGATGDDPRRLRAGARAAADRPPGTSPAHADADAETPGVEADPPPEVPTPTREPGLVLGDFVFSPQLQVRLRGEGRVDPYTALGTGRDRWFVTSRVRLGLGVEWEAVRMLLQIQDTRDLGDAPPGRDAGVNLHQGYVEVGEDGSFLRVGRQEIDYGGQRMLGALNWASPARSFDAARGVIRAGDLSVGGFAAIVGSPRDLEAAGPGGPVTVHSDGDYLGGLRGLWTPLDALTLDVYALYRHDGPAATNADRERDIVSPGVRVRGEPVEGLTYDVEGVFQTGRAGGEDHLAFGAAAEVGYRFDHPLRPAVALGGSYASGRSPDGDVDELDNFYPTNHKFYGFVDLFGFRNLVHGTARATLAPAELPLTVRLDLHTFALAEPEGRWSNAGGATLGQSSAPGSSSLGQEIDLTAAYRILDGLAFSGGYGIFLPNDGAARLGHGEPTHWMFLMLDAVAQP